MSTKTEILRKNQTAVLKLQIRSPERKVHQRGQQQTQMTEETSELEIKSIHADDQREER